MNCSAIHLIKIDEEEIAKNNKIKQKYIIIKNIGYTVVNYDKLGLCFNDYKTGLYRSIICSHPENQILSFSPPKTILNAIFIAKYPEMIETIIIKEWIEGILVHLFYDDRIGKWEMATKGFVGGKNSIKRKDQVILPITFQNMLKDVFRANKDEELHELPIFECFDKNLSYQFILKHPENIITNPVERPELYLISVYKICKLDQCIEYIPSSIYERDSKLRNILGIIEFPQQFHYNTYQEIYSIASQLGEHDCAGFIVTNEETGDRTTIKCMTYNHMSLLKTISTDMFYLYLSVSYTGKLSDFLNKNPGYKKDFFKINDEYKYFVANIYDEYCRYYIEKISKIEDIKYKKYIEKIHKEIFIPGLQCGKKKRITKQIIDCYFKEMEPREVMYILSI